MGTAIVFDEKNLLNLNSVNYTQYLLLAANRIIFSARTRLRTVDSTADSAAFQLLCCLPENGWTRGMFLVLNSLQDKSKLVYYQHVNVGVIFRKAHEWWKGPIIRFFVDLDHCLDSGRNCTALKEEQYELAKFKQCFNSNIYAKDCAAKTLLFFCS